MNIRNNIETTRVVNSKINLSILKTKDRREFLYPLCNGMAYPLIQESLFTCVRWDYTSPEQRYRSFPCIIYPD